MLNLVLVFKYQNNNSHFMKRQKTKENENRHLVLQKVPLSSIVTGPHQPRKIFQKEELEELASSIRSLGLLQPPVVRQKEGSTLYEIVSGERRTAACKKLGWTEIPVLIIQEEEEWHAHASLVENVQRVDLNPLEIAHALRRLMALTGKKQEEIASIIGKKRSTVSNYLRLLHLPEFIQMAIDEKKLSQAHAKTLLSCSTLEEQQRLFHEIVQKGLSVRQAEQSLKKKPKDLFFEEYQKKILHRFGVRALLKQKEKKGGTLTLEYDTQEQVEALDQALVAEG